MKDDKKVFHSVTWAYFQLSTAYEIVYGRKQKGGDMDEVPSLKKYAINAARLAQKVEFPNDILSEQEVFEFSTKLEYLLEEFPEAELKS